MKSKWSLVVSNNRGDTVAVGPFETYNSASNWGDRMFKECFFQIVPLYSKSKYCKPDYNRGKDDQSPESEAATPSLTQDHRSS